MATLILISVNLISMCMYDVCVMCSYDIYLCVASMMSTCIYDIKVPMVSIDFPFEIIRIKLIEFLKYDPFWEKAEHHYLDLFPESYNENFGFNLNIFDD